MVTEVAEFNMEEVFEVDPLVHAEGDVLVHPDVPEDQQHIHHAPPEPNPFGIEVVHEGEGLGENLHNNFNPDPFDDQIFLHPGLPIDHNLPEAHGGVARGQARGRADMMGQVPPRQLLLRHASQSSLDESSQKSGKYGDPKRPPYKNLNHPMKLIEGMNNLRIGGLLCDVTLVADSHEIPAHKMILAACSPYFYAMFTGFTERDRDRVVIHDVEPEALSILVDYVYTSQVDVTEENVQILLPAANLMQLNDVRDACCEFLQSQLHPTNCLGIRRFADLHCCEDLLIATECYIECHFTEVLECDEFYNLDAEQVAKLISSDTITVPNEEKVFESVISWIQYDAVQRSTYLHVLMEHVRLPLLSQEYLIQRVTTDNLIKDNNTCKDYIIEALQFHLTKGDLKMQMTLTSPRTKPRQPIGLPKVMAAIGGQAPKAIRSVECYDFKDERWIHLSEMPSRRCRCGVAVVRGKVYAVGGFNGSLRVRTVDVYDPTNDTWSSIASMEARRSTLGVAVLNDMIFAVGGFDGSAGLNTAEVLDLTLNGSQEWRSIASLATRRSSVGVGVLGGLIYAVGGYDGNSRQCLSSVEVYNPEQDIWSPVSDMFARRSGAGVGVLHGLLYSVGGHDGPVVRKSVESYNPDTNRWSPVADMKYARRNAGVIAHNGLLYVIGGDDGTSNLASVEVYSPKTDSWAVIPANMTIGRSYTGVCIIEKPSFLA